MRRLLRAHPDTPCPAIASIAVEATRPAPNRIDLNYRLEGDLGAIALPQAGPVRRGDRLWEGSCFEAFVRAGGDEGYCELNFAPSRAWAAYRFDSYRSGMTEAELPAPEIESNRGDGWITLGARVALDLPPDRAWQLGLATIVAAPGGERSFWALAHPPGEPDFHRRDCFVIDLQPPGRR